MTALRCWRIATTARFFTSRQIKAYGRILDSALPAARASERLPEAVFNYSDNSLTRLQDRFLESTNRQNILTRRIMSFRLGATGQGGPPDGNLYAPQVPAATGPYLLWSSGTDTFFGTDDDIVNNMQ